MTVESLKEYNKDYYQRNKKKRVYFDTCRVDVSYYYWTIF